MNVPAYVRGSIAPVFTAYNEDLTLDDQGQRNLLDFLLSFNSISAFFCRSGMGQMYEFSREDLIQLIDNVCGHMAGKAPVLIGCNGIWNRDKSEGGRPDPQVFIDECIEFGNYATKAGAEGVVYTVPEALLPQGDEDHQDLAVRFFETVSAAVDAPVFIYQPPRTEGDYELRPQTLRKIAALPNVVAIKVSNPNGGYLFDMIRATRDLEFAYICGAENAFYTAAYAGGKACIGQGASLNPQMLNAVQDCIDAGDTEGAFAAQDAVNLMCEECPNPVEWLKRYAADKGYAVNPYGRPMTIKVYEDDDKPPMSQEEYEAFKTVFEREMAKFGAGVSA
jgi:4-hydroxy-tetrahydrodipicolinate synthase